MKFVLDASMALAWLFERAKKEEIDYANKALFALVDNETSVPPLWHIEIANALLVGERRHVITEAQSIDYLNRLSGLPIVTDDICPSSRRDMVIALAREHQLTAYDATYLELALRRDAVLATFDIELAKAMHNAGGKVFADIGRKAVK
ncbi:MAG: type II toxin-antitoxin system VapC family toxin [Gammaproteobacteria bacterium]